MTTELTVLAWGAVLLLVHIILAVLYKTRQYGTKWNVGARDEALPPVELVVGRLERARENFLETFPIAIVAMLAIALTDRSSALTQVAAWTWLGARVIYLPLYWAGVPVIRTLVFCVGMLALLVLLGSLLTG
jgi:uncharacterized MAPEG superfamily protein